MKRKGFLMVVVFTMIMLAISFSTVLAYSPFKFAVIADPHISVAGPNSPKNSTKMYKESTNLLESTVNEINQQSDIDFVVVLGDLTKDSEPWNVDRVREILGELKAPWYVVLGNHDVSPVDTFQSERSPGVSRSTMIWTFQGHGYNGYQQNWSTDPLPGIHLVGLDTSLTGTWGGQVSNEGLKFLKQNLAAHSDKLTIVILHHQLQAYTREVKENWNGVSKYVANNADEVRNIIKDNPQVLLTLSGHRHISTRFIDEDDTTYFTCPSTMTWPMRYVIFEVDQDKISYNTKDIPCSTEVWQEAKDFTMASQFPSWYDTAKEYTEMIASPATLTDTLVIPSSVQQAIGY